jgi:hypothetical protein
MSGLVLVLWSVFGGWWFDVIGWQVHSHQPTPQSTINNQLTIIPLLTSPPPPTTTTTTTEQQQQRGVALLLVMAVGDALIASQPHHNHWYAYCCSVYSGIGSVGGVGGV